jgi:vacuolar-type H+-ATPase subunit I/STV1
MKKTRKKISLPMMLVFQVDYSVEEKHYRCEYVNEHEATTNYFDIQGYIPSASLKRVTVPADYKVTRGPVLLENNK